MIQVFCYHAGSRTESCWFNSCHKQWVSFFVKWGVLFRLVRYHILLVLYKLYRHLCKREAVVWRWLCICRCNFWWLKLPNKEIYHWWLVYTYMELEKKKGRWVTLLKFKEVLFLIFLKLFIWWWDAVMSFRLLEVFKTGPTLQSCRFADKWGQSVHTAVTFHREEKVGVFVTFFCASVM